MWSEYHWDIWKWQFCLDWGLLLVKGDETDECAAFASLKTVWERTDLTISTKRHKMAYELTQNRSEQHIWGRESLLINEEMIYEMIIYELRIWNQGKLWSSQLWTQFLQLGREAWKIQDFNGVWTRDLAIPVRRSNQLSFEATDVGSWSFVGSNVPVRNESTM